MKLAVLVEFHKINLPGTYSVGSSPPLFLQRLNDRFCPAASVLEDIGIYLSHTDLADTMTKLNL